jgi:cyclic pyranopterin phosphate synthase
MRCVYCKPGRCEDNCPDSLGELCLDTMLEIVRFLRVQFGLSKVHLTGGEPLMRAGIVDLVRGLRVEAISDIAMTTNGQLLARNARELRQAGLHRVNISLDSLRPDMFSRLSRGGILQRTLDGISAAMASGLRPMKLNVTVLRPFNLCEVCDLARFGLDRGMEVRFLELMPIGPAAGQFQRWYVSSEEVRDVLSSQFTLQSLSSMPTGSTRRHTAHDGGDTSGTIGFISAVSEPFCSGCRRLRLTAAGRLVGCLAEGRGVDLVPVLGLGGTEWREGLVRAIQRAMAQKRRGTVFRTDRLMAETGG